MRGRVVCFMAGTHFSERFSDKNLFIAACVCYNIKNEIFSNSVEKIIALLRLMGKGEKSMPKNENIGAGMSEKDIGAELYEKWLGGEETAFDKIIDIYHDGLIFFVYGTLKNFADAEDIAADTFAELIVHKNRYSFGCSLKTYLFSVARNKAIDRLRKRKRISDSDISENEESITDGKLLEEKLISDERSKIVREALETINKEYAQILRLTYFYGFSGDEICIIMKKNKKQTANLLYRGKEALKKVLAERGIESI